jgi:epoxyqueuosine reductase
MKNPRLVLMSCCAPCSTDAIKQLKNKGLDFTVLFFNPNVFPESEYNKRLAEQINLCKKLDVKYATGDYNHKDWLECIKGSEKEPEHGGRCDKCFAHRFKFGLDWAKENGFDAITSVFGVSQHKDQSQVDRVANRVLNGSDIEYIKFDFLYKPEQDIYKQKYCGCEFSETFNGKPVN